MATFAHYKVTTTADQTISAKDTTATTTDYESGTYITEGTGTSVESVKGAPTSIVITNIDANGPVTFHLWLSDGTTDRYIMYKYVLPFTSTLVLEHPEINYDSFTYDLKFKLTSVAASEQVDIKVQYN
tara:strand:+ start:770 stop:1153 length:384 start_codon:yes stop_codon:yes gene_type:complete